MLRLEICRKLLDDGPVHVVIASCRPVASIASFGDARGKVVENAVMRAFLKQWMPFAMENQRWSLKEVSQSDYNPDDINNNIPSNGRRIFASQRRQQCHQMDLSIQRMKLCNSNSSARRGMASSCLCCCCRSCVPATVAHLAL